METFVDQLWVVLMSAFVVVALVVISACSIWLVKVFAERFFQSKALKEYEDNLLRSFMF